jgi:hypothetical protein
MLRAPCTTTAALCRRGLRPLLGGQSRSARPTSTQRSCAASKRGKRVERQLEDLRRRADRTQAGDPDALARAFESRENAEDAAWRRSRVRVNDGTFDSARRFDETLDAELDALTSAVKDHADALRRSDVGIVFKLLDEVLTEQASRSHLSAAVCLPWHSSRRS